ncbi:MAG: HAD hydrolase family protein [Oscillospiraceae bacterium]|nr:HAD hydrolase family protein [Oscillospiraceae bacterium]
MDLKSRAAKIRLLALDLDGTLLLPDGTLSDRAANVLQRLSDRGMLIALTTGRPLDRAYEPHPVLRRAQYLIAVNGALVADRDGNILLRRTIPGDRAAQLAARLFAPENIVYVNALTALHIASGNGHTLFGRPVTDLPTLLSDMAADGGDALSVGVQLGDPALFPAYEAMAAREYPELDTFRVDATGLELVPRGADKRTALRMLCERHDLTPENVCALGDNDNDTQMLRFAGLGVAMGNSIERAKRAADLVIGGNAHDAAAEFLELAFFGGV